MSDTAAHITRNVAAIRARMRRAAEAAGRDPADVALVAVTKYAGLEEMRALLAAGVTHLAENRVDIAAPKVAALGREGLCWHMIGQVQTRKAREVVSLFDQCDAVDRLKLAEALQRRCEAADRASLPVLVEVNVAGESQKAGIPPEELDAYLRGMVPFDRLKVQGLMTMAPYEAPEPELRRIFRTLRALVDAHGLDVCSMGMTDDFEWAIAEGATEVRIGRALFEQ